MTWRVGDRVRLPTGATGVIEVVREDGRASVIYDDTPAWQPPGTQFQRAGTREARSVTVPVRLLQAPRA